MTCVLCKTGQQDCAECGYKFPDGHECGKHICTPDCPPYLLDPHGATCNCDCERTICAVHWSPHAREHHGGEPLDATARCFGANAQAVILPALARSVDTLVAGWVEERGQLEAIEAWNRFLNLVTPGHRALADAVSHLAADEYTVDRTIWEAFGEQRVDFSAGFYTDGTVERVFRLAARSAGVAWSGRGRRAMPPTARRALSQPGRITLLDQLGSWTAGGDRPDDVAIAAWVSPETSDAVRDAGIRRLASSLALGAPEDTAVVAWLVGLEVARVGV